MRRAPVSVATLLIVLSAARAQGYVRSLTDMGKPFYWDESCVPLTIYLNGFDRTSGMTLTQIVKSLTAAAHTWSTDAVSCTSGDVTTSPYLEIVPTLAPTSATPPNATDRLVQGSYDMRNSIIFRTESWSNSGKPGHAYADEALAVTTVTALEGGKILDADMEINGVSTLWRWVNLDDPGDGANLRVHDLQNTVTHEFGHFLGLGHTCFFSGRGGQDLSSDGGKLPPKDDQGNAVPNCETAPEAIKDTVMFPQADPGETKKRVLSSDDVRAVCEIYAPSIAHLDCPLDSANPGCAVAAVPPWRHAWRRLRFGLPLGALAVLATLAARQRRRRVSDPGRARA